MLKNTLLLFTFTAAISTSVLACGEDVQTCDVDCGQGGNQGGAGQGGNQGGNQGGAGQGGNQGGAGQGGNQGGAGQGGQGPMMCGGIAGIQCDPGFFCDFQPSTCGGSDDAGVCVPTPMGCTDEFFPTCGCDGVVHSNPCEANAAGVDISVVGGCPPPAVANFPCGAGFCDFQSHYCERSISDIAGEDDTFACKPYPMGCGNVAQCACLSAQPCGDMCDNINNGLTLTCPGG